MIQHQRNHVRNIEIDLTSANQAWHWTIPITYMVFPLQTSFPCLIPRAQVISLSEAIKVYTLWLFNVAMENGPFIDDFPTKTTIYRGFSMAMLNNQMVKIAKQQAVSWKPHGCFPSMHRGRDVLCICLTFASSVCHTCLEFQIQVGRQWFFMWSWPS